MQIPNDFFGWCGRILKIDLTDGSTHTEILDPSLCHQFVGGRGLAGYYLRPHVSLPWDDPAMPLLLFTGPLVNTTSPTSGRMTVMSRSPLTGTVGDCSVGGSLGTQLKRAGWDGIIITGQSPKLCGIEIVNDQVQIIDAQNFAGLKTSSLHDNLKGKGATAIIGPAAENGVLFASLMVDSHYTAGRGGIGLSFAAKKIKYLTVKGNQPTRIFNADLLKEARADVMRLLSASPALTGELGLTHFGTGALYDLMDARRMMPTDNFQKSFFPHAHQMNAFAYRQKYRTKSTGCHGCPVLCKKKSADNEAVPEFETMSHFSALIGNTDLDAVMQANKLCNELGMDTISAAATIACFLEIEKTNISAPALFSLLTDMAGKKGTGASLAEGSYRYTLRKGRPELSMSVKKLELPGYDPRGAYGMALAYALSTRGGCHLRAYPISHEILRKPVATNRFTFDGKARIIKTAEDLNAVVDSLTVCKFLFFAVSLHEYAKIYYAVTGVNSCAEDLLTIGERIYYQERMMNASNGFTAQDDDLPARFFQEGAKDFQEDVLKSINRADFLGARAKYYRIRGLDDAGGPTQAEASQLEIPWND